MTWKLFQEREVIFLDDVLSLIAVVEVVLNLSFLLITKDKDLYPKLDFAKSEKAVPSYSIKRLTKCLFRVFLLPESICI